MNWGDWLSHHFCTKIFEQTKHSGMITRDSSILTQPKTDRGSYSWLCVCMENVCDANKKQKTGIQVSSQPFCVFREIHVANAHNAMTWWYLSPLLYVVVLMMEMTSGMQFTVEMLNRSSEVFTEMSEGMCGVMKRLYYFNDMATGAYVGCRLTNIRLVEWGPLTRNQKFKVEYFLFWLSLHLQTSGTLIWSYPSDFHLCWSHCRGDNSNT